jgi:radical SAM enzyme (TIGR01210 family)
MYPAATALRDHFVLSRRPGREPVDPASAHALTVEDELGADRRVTPVATVFLTGRECPWRCVMCDLWRHTTIGDTPRGAIPRQVADARRVLATRDAAVETLKLYNAGSFFDPRAVPDADYDAVAVGLAGLRRVIVESHPALVGPRTGRLIDALRRRAAADGHAPTLEVAMGLETVNPDALDRLNKRMTVDAFRSAADRLHALGAAVRVFLLIAPPFIAPAAQDEWLLRSVDAAFASGAAAVSLIPVRSGNGAMDALATSGDFRPPTLADIERSMTIARDRSTATGRLFLDLWELPRFAACPHCLEPRRARLHAMNVHQRDEPPVPCAACGGSWTA